MKVSAIIFSGKKTDVINGEPFTVECVEVVAAFLSYARAEQVLKEARIDVAEPLKWGIRTACVYEFEVQA